MVTIVDIAIQICPFGHLTVAHGPSGTPPLAPLSACPGGPAADAPAYACAGERHRPHPCRPAAIRARRGSRHAPW